VFPEQRSRVDHEPLYDRRQPHPEGDQRYEETGRRDAKPQPGSAPGTPDTWGDHARERRHDAKDRKCREPRRAHMDIDVAGARERVAAGGCGLAELEHVALEVKPPRRREQEGGGEDGQVHLGLVGRAKRPQRERASHEIHEHRRGDRDRDEPEQQPRHQELEPEREDEESNVLAGRRIQHAEGLPVAPQQKGLPVLGGRRRDRGANDERRGDDGERGRARPGATGARERDEEVQRDEGRSRAGDQEPELGFRRRHAAEDVKLPKRVEPDRAGQDLRRHIQQEERQSEQDDDERRAPAGPEEPRPLGRARVVPARTRRRGCIRRRDSRDRSEHAGRPSPAASVQAPMLRKELVDTFPTRNPDEPVSPRLPSPAELSLAKQPPDRLSACSQQIGGLGDREVVRHRGNFSRTFPK
jgi:hypothetical protein